MLILPLILMVSLGGCHKGDNNTAGFSGKILMLGRSVMGGWFEHWGDYSHVQKDGYDLYYGEMQSPPAIVNSAISRMDSQGVDSKWIVFFKLCFVDFYGGSQQEAQENLARNKEYVREVYEQVKSRGAILIVGNALPQVCEYTTSYLKWNHSQYNAWLEEMARENEGFYVFDMYSVLVNSKGCLRSDYSVSPYDSHLNDKAYSALDAKFFPFLKNNFKVVSIHIPGF